MENIIRAVIKQRKLILPKSIKITKQLKQTVNTKATDEKNHNQN
jgi:hypothetical protein